MSALVAAAAARSLHCKMYVSALHGGCEVIHCGLNVCARCMIYTGMRGLLLLLLLDLLGSSTTGLAGRAQPLLTV